MVPGRDQLFIIGSDDEAGLALILKRADFDTEAGRPCWGDLRGRYQVNRTMANRADTVCRESNLS